MEMRGTENRLEDKYVFSFWDKIKNQIDAILRNNAQVSFIGDVNKTVYEPVVNIDSGVIVVKGNMQQLKAVDEYIKKVQDSITKEVLIDVRIYSVELSKSHKTGIDWSKLNISLGDTSVPLRLSNVFGSNSIFKASTFNAQAFLTFLAQNGNVNSISNPKVVTLNNQKALMSIGDTIYYKTQRVVTDKNGNVITVYEIKSKFVGVVLDIVPQISDNGVITLNISPRINSFRDINQLNNSARDLPPDTRDSTMQTIVRMKDGEVLVLGGLITDDKSLRVNGVPILKEIPVLKYLFSSRETISNKKEIVFVITPHIIRLNKKKTLRDLGFGKIR
jgi:general secretion pathway protein D